MLLTAIICIIVGMGMPTAALYILVATLVAPPLVKVGVDPLAAHLFVLYFGLMSMITPPVALAAYAASNLAGSSPIETALTAIRLAWPAYVVPFMFALAPTLILKGGALRGECRGEHRGGGYLAGIGRLSRVLLPADGDAPASRLRGWRVGAAGAGRGLPGRPCTSTSLAWPWPSDSSAGSMWRLAKLVRGRRILVEPRVGTVRRPGSRAACGGSTRHGGERDGQGARRDSGSRSRPGAGGSDHRHAAGRSGGGGHQDRAPRRRRPIPLLSGRFQRRQHEQAERVHRSAHARWNRGTAAARRGRRCAARELPSRCHGTSGAGSGNAARAQPTPDCVFDLGLRRRWPLPDATRLRHQRHGVERLHEPAGRSGKTGRYRAAHR